MPSHQVIPCLRVLHGLSPKTQVTLLSFLRVKIVVTCVHSVVIVDYREPTINRRVQCNKLYTGNSVHSIVIESARMHIGSGRSHHLFHQLSQVAFVCSGGSALFLTAVLVLTNPSCLLSTNNNRLSRVCLVGVCYLVRWHALFSLRLAVY